MDPQQTGTTSPASGGHESPPPTPERESRGSNTVEAAMARLWLRQLLYLLDDLTLGTEIRDSVEAVMETLDDHREHPTAQQGGPPSLCDGRPTKRPRYLNYVTVARLRIVDISYSDDDNGVNNH